MKITVTKADIELGRRNIASITVQGPSIERCCPVAVALGRMGISSDVCTHHIKLDGREIIMPDKAIAWIRRFDRTRRARPFSFDLPL